MTITETAPRELTISEAAALTGVSTHTLRYYERAGLMRELVPRAASTHRRYRDDDIGWVHFITRLRSTGMSIQQIRRYADMARAGDVSEEERLRLLEAHKERVEQQLVEVQQHLAAITFKIDMYRDRIEQRIAQNGATP